MRFGKFDQTALANNDFGTNNTLLKSRFKRAAKGNVADQAWIRDVVEITALAINVAPSQLWQAMQSKTPMQALHAIQLRKGLNVELDKYAQNVRSRLNWAMTLRHPTEKPTDIDVSKMSKSTETELAKSIINKAA